MKSQIFDWLPILPLIFLFGSAMLTMLSTSLLQLGKIKAKNPLRIRSFFFFILMKKFFPKDEWENLYYTLSFTRHLLSLLYATTAFFYFANHIHQTLDWIELIFIALGIIAVSIVIDFCTRLLATLWSRGMLRFSAPIASIFLTVFFPIVGILLKITRALFQVSHIYEQPESFFLIRERFREMIHETELSQHLDAFDQKLITSFITFREKVAREIMIPRVDVTFLENTATLHEATRLFIDEGYSRIPVYRETLDEIIGVLYSKDLLEVYENSSKEALQVPVEKIVKPVLFTPENKRISHLLQEFRNKQIHLAIVVDEYGGTEGIVTIEDILEELVGEIEDEYDIEEEAQFWKLPGGGFVVDAKMSIIDIEEKLHIHIPHSPEYETIGGYVFHRAGTIPSKGWKLHSDEFELEVLNSNDRSIERIRITALKKG